MWSSLIYSRILRVILIVGFPKLEGHPHHHPPGSDPGEEDPVIDRDSVAFRHASYLNPHYEFEGNFRDALSSFQDGSGGGSSLLCLTRQKRTECSGNEEYRTYDGSCNNIANPSWGMSGLPYDRVLPPNHGIDSFQCGRRNTNLPNPRTVSINLVRRGSRDTHEELSNYVMLWGQMIDHDILISPVRMTRNGDFLDCCHPLNSNHEDCCPVRASNNDPFYGASHRPKCQSMLRSKIVPQLNCSGETDVENGNSVFIDGSFIYGSSEERALLLRTMADGLMKVTEDRFGRHFPPISSTSRDTMEFGDIRGDSTLASTMIVTAFLRNHNKLVHGLKIMHPNWNDEKLFQEARKINVGMIQHVTYSEYIDTILGTPNNLQISEHSGHQDFYDPSINPTCTLEFADAGFRLHTLIGSFFNCVDSHYRLKKRMLLRDVFRVPMKLLENSTYDDLMRGSVVQPLHNFNNMYSTEMTEWMFRKGNNDFGLDIVAITIQRGRDHRLPGYIAYREKCGLGTVRSWKDMADLIPSDIVNRMRRTYLRVQDVDLDAGVILETPVFGAEIGPTMHCLVRDQFKRIRDGDRFFYTRPGQFTNRQLRAIKSVKLADILCANSDDHSTMALPRNVFNTAHPVRNPVFRCKDHLKFDIEAWRRN